MTTVSFSWWFQSLRMRKKKLRELPVPASVWPKDLVDSDKSVPQKVSHFFISLATTLRKSPHRVGRSGSGLPLPDGSLLLDDCEGPEKKNAATHQRYVGCWVGWSLCSMEWRWNDSFFVFVFPQPFDKIRKKLQRLPSWLIYFFRWATMVIYSPTNFHASQSYKSRKTFTNSSCKPDF